MDNEKINFHEQEISPDAFNLMKAKLRSYVKLVQYMRLNQKEYFYYKKHHDEQNAAKRLRSCFELEKRVDQESDKMLDLAKTHFQPELFK